MTHPVLQYLGGLATRLAADPDVLALLALGSAGLHTERLDEHSDADFFVITAAKERLLDDPSWLGEPLRWAHRNTPDGYVALVGGLFCEFAVFEPSELPGIPFAPGRIVWARSGFDAAALSPAPRGASPDPEWLAAQTLTHLYVGLHRWLRGERLAAQRKVQLEAVDTLLRLLGSDDPFDPARRAERRLDLPWGDLVGGYDHTPRSARTVLELLPDDRGPMRDEVVALLNRC